MTLRKGLGTDGQCFSLNPSPLWTSTPALDLRIAVARVPPEGTALVLDYLIEQADNRGVVALSTVVFILESNAEHHRQLCPRSGDVHVQNECRVRYLGHGLADHLGFLARVSPRIPQQIHTILGLSQNCQTQATWRHKSSVGLGHVRRLGKGAPPQ